MKKNVAALVFSILGTVFGIIGAIIWAACADTCADIVGSSTMWTVGFIVLGVGGGVVSLIGGIQAFRFRPAGFVMSLLGCLLQVGTLVLECVFVEGFSFVLSLWTLLAIVMLVLATVFSKRKS